MSDMLYAETTATIALFPIAAAATKLLTATAAL